MDNHNQYEKNKEILAHIVEAVRRVIITGQSPKNLPPFLANNEDFNRILSDLEGICRFSLDLANGKLEPELKVKGKLAGSLKSLQANLRHLTWQTQRIAAGDYNQEIEFIGDFSTALNTLVKKLEEDRIALEKHAGELSMYKQNALKLMMDVQMARDDLEKANAQIQSQLEEIHNLHMLLREQAIRDQLTGLFNRRYLMETLERELARAQRGNYPVSLIMVDLDHFKSINDTYGNRVGDIVLQSLGKMLLIKTRLDDIPCRYGGEEIVIVFPNVNAEVTAQRAESLRHAFEELSINNAGLTIYATFSAGVASYPEHATDIESLLQKADQALKSAKNAGRNRVNIYKNP